MRHAAAVCQWPSCSSHAGIDVTTGKTTLSVPLGASRSLFEAKADPAIAGATQLVLAASAAPLVLDFVTGKAERPAPGATFWCIAGPPPEWM